MRKKDRSNLQPPAKMITPDDPEIFRMVFESMQEGCALHKMIYDSRGRAIDYSVIDINPAYEKILDLKKDHVIGKKGSALYGTGQPPYLDEYDRVVTTGHSYTFETHFEPLDRHFSISVFTPGKDLFATVFSDITSRKLSESVLREREQQFRMMFESHQAVMLLIDPINGEIVDANPAAVNFYGYPRETLCQMKISTINQLNPEQTRQEWQKAVTNQRNYFVFPHQLANGQIRNVEVYSSPVNLGNRQILFSIIHDITERVTIEEKLKVSEKLYRSLFDNMLNGFAYCQMVNVEGQPPNFIYLAVNAAFSQLTGLKNVIGKRVSEVIPGIQTADSGLLETYNRVAASEKPEQFETYVQSLQMWFSISVYCPQKGYFVAIFDVITERKKAEATLKAELSAREHFMNLLAHEIRAPLSPILNSTAMLRDLVEAGDDDRLKRLAANAVSGARILANRLDELLDFARFSRGAISLSLKPTVMTKFITEVISRYRPVIDQSEHQLIVNMEEDLAEVQIDRSRFEQVLINLLSNAVKYSPSGTRIELRTSWLENKLRIDVKDEGHGLSESDRQYLFQPYHRLERDRNKSSGLGLGLSICQQIIEAHHGQIEVISELGKGSVFRVTIPIVQP